MASNTKEATESRNAAVDGRTALLNNGDIQVWEAVAGDNPPATPATAISDDNTNYKLLATCTFGATAFGAASSGTGTANAIGSDTNAAKSGTAEFVRLRTSGGATRVQATAGETADTPDFVFDNKTIVAGGTVAISSLTFTQPIGGT